MNEKMTEKEEFDRKYGQESQVSKNIREGKERRARTELLWDKLSKIHKKDKRINNSYQSLLQENEQLKKGIIELTEELDGLKEEIDNMNDAEE